MRRSGIDGHADCHTHRHPRSLGLATHIESKETNYDNRHSERTGREVAQKRADKLVNNRELINKRLADAVERLTEARTRQVDLDAVQNTVQYVGRKGTDQLRQSRRRSCHQGHPPCLPVQAQRELRCSASARTGARRSAS